MNSKSEMAGASKNDALREREKELSCLYVVASELESIDGLTDELLGKIVEHIPPGFQFPEVTVARVVLADKEYQTASFRETTWSLVSAIKDDGNQISLLEVCYLEERPESDEGPFLKQERKLLDCLAGLLRNNLKFQQSVEAIRANEKKYQTIVETATEGIWQLDAQANTTYVNRQMAEMLGYERDEMLGRSLLDFMDEKAREEAKRLFKKRKEGISEQHEFRFRKKDGSDLWTIISTNPLIDDHGEFAGALGMIKDITLRKRAEEALRESESHFRTIYDQSPLGMGFIDKDGYIVDCNEQLSRIIGTSRERLIGFNMISGVKDEAMKSAVAAALLGKIGLFEGDYVTVTSTRQVTLKATYGPLLYPDNVLKGVLFLCEDITERKRAEEALELSETNLRRAQWIGNLGSWSWDVPTNELNWSDQVFRIYGLDPKHTEPSYDIVIKTLAPECREDFAKAIQDALEKDEPFEGDYCIILPDGSRRNTHTAGKVIRDEQRNPLKMFGIVQDITERKRMERELHDASSYTRSLIETSLDPLVTISSDGKIMDVNKATEVVTGVPRDELIGSDFSNYFTEPEQAREGYQQVFETGSIMDYPLAIKHVSGRKTDVLYNAAVYRDDTGKIAGVFAAARDITKRKQAEEEKEKLREQLMQSQKMESVGRLAGGIAHDFNNALQTILGNTTLMMMEVPEGSKGNSLRENLEAVQRAGEHSADLTRQLLAFARQQTVETRLVDLNDTVADILSMLKRLIGEDINVSWLPEAEAATIKVDPAQVYQVLANLCINAREAIEGVGNVTIETHNISFDSAYVEDHAGFETGDYVMLEVSDDGCGMDKEVRDHLFEPFYTTRAFGKGTGLGLATVYGIVKQNDGFINVYSEPGEGTTFKIYLSLAVGKPAGREEAPVQLPRGHGETVLLVEDDVDILKLGTEILERMGYRVIAAATPDEAIDKAQKQIGEIALLVTDVVMPQMNGHDLATRLQELKPELKCLYMSGYTADVITNHGVLDEGLNFMQKPFSIEDVAAKVRHLLDSE
ncbi:MAG: PAS domain S-box protein [Thermoleophilia bacterium]|nr:PAS domain S-box protein [Thermoleophilia bacterium]